MRITRRTGNRGLNISAVDGFQVAVTGGAPPSEKVSLSAWTDKGEFVSIKLSLSEAREIYRRLATSELASNVRNT